MMKNILIVLIILVSIHVSSQNFNTALDYLKFVSEQQENITKKMWKYTKAIAHSRSDRNIRTQRKNLLVTLDRAISKIKKAPGYDGREFKDQLLKRLTFNKNLLNNEYAKILDMKEIAEQSYDAMEAYMLARELADKKMEEVQQEYEANYEAFAEKHNITLIENESDLSKNMEISNQVFKYYNKMYLVYFKVFINEIYLMNALESNDINAIQQNANALQESAQEGLELLKEIEHYKNDRSIATATQQCFEFFITEAKDYIPKMTEFLILGEDLKEAQKTKDKTPKNKRTKQQIDSFNKMVSQYNKGVKTYNKTNTDLNKLRNKVIEQLNTTNQMFLNKHIPNN